MKKKLKIFIPVFLIVTIGVLFLYYWISGRWAESLAIGVISGFVVSAIISLAVPFITSQKKRRSGKPKNKK